VSGKYAVIFDTYYELAIKNDSGIIIEDNYHIGRGYDNKNLKPLHKVGNNLEVEFNRRVDIYFKNFINNLISTK